ncbi:MAG: sulfatase [Pseudomonadota bacterium]
MLRKYVLWGVTITAVCLAAGYHFRLPIATFLVGWRLQAMNPVGPAQEVIWRQGPATPANTNKPNIVFILADDLGINDISTFGGGLIPTPNIDRLAEGGVSFSQAYSGTASCAPSRGMIMTGRYPTRTGFEFTPTPEGMARLVTMAGNSNRNGRPKYILNPVTDNPLPFDDQGLPSEEVTLAEILKDAGYRTAHIGKWHMGRGPGFDPNDQGFEESLLMGSGLYLPEDDQRVVNAKLDFDPVDNFLWAGMKFGASFNGSDWFEPGGYLTDWWTDEAIDLMESSKNEPFFLYLAHWAVHTPLQATVEDFEAVGEFETHRERVYAAMIRSLDRSVGNVFNYLEESGQLENTIIVFSSDNGAPGYIGMPEANAPYRGWKLSFFEGGIRVPMFIHWPAKIKAGLKIEAPISHIDLLPTLVSAAGASLPADRVIDGRNLLPLALGETTDRPHETLFWQSDHYHVVRHGDWKLQRNGLSEKMFLFNLAEDPTEQQNLVESEPQVVEQLLGLLDEHHRDAIEPLYKPKLVAPIAMDVTINQPVTEDSLILYWPN